LLDITAAAAAKSVLVLVLFVKFVGPVVVDVVLV